jgi:hypothetical protein
MESTENKKSLIDTKNHKKFLSEDETKLLDDLNKFLL